MGHSSWINQEKVQQLHSRIYWKLLKENHKMCGVIEVKSFTTRHFYTI